MDAKELADAALSRVAGEAVAAMPSDEIRALAGIVVKGVVEKAADNWELKRRIEQMVAEAGTAECRAYLESPQGKAVVAMRTRSMLERFWPAFEVAMVKTLLHGFSADSSYRDAVFAKFAAEAVKGMGIELPERK